MIVGTSGSSGIGFVRPVNMTKSGQPFSWYITGLMG